MIVKGSLSLGRPFLLAHVYGSAKKKKKPNSNSRVRTRICPKFGVFEACGYGRRWRLQRCPRPVEGAQEPAVLTAAAQSRPHAGIRPSQLTALETEEAVLRWSRVSAGLAASVSPGPGRGRSAELSGRARWGGRKVRQRRAVSARGRAGRPDRACSVDTGLPCSGPGGRLPGRQGDRAGRTGPARPGAGSSAALPAQGLWPCLILPPGCWGSHTDTSARRLAGGGDRAELMPGPERAGSGREDE